MDSPNRRRLWYVSHGGHVKVALCGWGHYGADTDDIISYLWADSNCIKSNHDYSSNIFNSVAITPF